MGDRLSEAGKKVLLLGRSLLELSCCKYILFRIILERGGPSVAITGGNVFWPATPGANVSFLNKAILWIFF